jgi:hypothetical protein
MHQARLTIRGPAEADLGPAPVEVAGQSYIPEVAACGIRRVKLVLVGEELWDTSPRDTWYMDDQRDECLRTTFLSTTLRGS